ncbi:MAG: SPOR domain-containing protein [Thermochromatium sp.]
MRQEAKKRLVGAVVIITLVVIFVPMLFEDAPPEPPSVQKPRPTPVLQDPFVPRTSPLPADTGGLTVEEALLTPPQPMQAFETAGPASFEDKAEALTVEPMQEPASPKVTPPRETRPATQPPTSRNQTQAPKPTQPLKAAQQPAQTPSPKPETSVLLPEPPRSRADGPPSWVVQVSSLGSPEAAGKLADSLKQSGFSAFVERAEVGGKIYYRVRVGPDIDRANAERTADMLRKQHKLDPLIQRYH